MVIFHSYVELPEGTPQKENSRIVPWSDPGHPRKPPGPISSSQQCTGDLPLRRLGEAGETVGRSKENPQM